MSGSADILTGRHTGCCRKSSEEVFLLCMICTWESPRNLFDYISISSSKDRIVPTHAVCTSVTGRRRKKARASSDSRARRCAFTSSPQILPFHNSERNSHLTHPHHSPLTISKSRRIHRISRALRLPTTRSIIPSNSIVLASSWHGSVHAATKGMHATHPTSSATTSSKLGR